MDELFDYEDPAFDNEDVDDATEETSLVDPTETDSMVGPLTETSSTNVTSQLQSELLQSAVDDYYNALARKGVTPAIGRDPLKFELVDGQLRLKAYPNLSLINVRTREPLSLSTVAARPGGRSAIQEDLGFVDWSSVARRPPKKVITALQTASNDLGGAATAVETVQLQDLGQAAKEASDTVHEMETTLSVADLGIMDEPPLNFRELRGLDKAMRTIRGELTNNLAKLSELDNHIVREKQKLDQAEDEFSRRRIAERLRDLQDERSARLEAASSSREALRSQITRIRETISRVLNGDTTLAERIRTIFREQGVTIVSVLTAIGMAISTLVLALTGGVVVPTPTPPSPPSDKGGLKEWVKKHLQGLGRVLAKLAGKAAAALPGIIGSVVSWLLNMLAKTTGWLAGNLWALVLAVGGVLLVSTRQWLAPDNPKRQ